MKSLLLRVLFCSPCLLSTAAHACSADGESTLFACEAMHGRKYIELCSKDLAEPSGYLVYRFGA